MGGQLEDDSGRPDLDRRFALCSVPDLGTQPPDSSSCAAWPRPAHAGRSDPRHVRSLCGRELSDPPLRLLPPKCASPGLQSKLLGFSPGETWRTVRPHTPLHLRAASYPENLTKGTNMIQITW